MAYKNQAEFISLLHITMQDKASQRNRKKNRTLDVIRIIIIIIFLYFCNTICNWECK